MLILLFWDLLQWGRTREGPEMNQGASAYRATTSLQWGRTREGPEITTSQLRQPTNYPLQWGRTREGPEIVLYASFAPLRFRFNGAGPVRVRR